jgi:transcriptional regulator with XRE-family HTH domain
MYQRHTIRITVGRNIRAWRELKGLKQEYLATKVGICKSTLSYIENGVSDVGITRLAEIAAELEIQILQLFIHPLEQNNLHTSH